MSELQRNLPPVVVKQGKMFFHSTSKMKAALVAAGVVFCLYLLLVLASEFTTTKKLDRITQMLAQSERDLLYLEKLDQELDARIKSLKINYKRF